MVNHPAVIVLRRTITALPKIRQGGLVVYCFMLAVIRCALTNRFIARACQGDAFIFEHLWRREIDCYTICIVQAFLQVEYNQKLTQQGRVRAKRKNGGERGRNKENQAGSFGQEIVTCLHSSSVFSPSPMIIRSCFLHLDASLCVQMGCAHAGSGEGIPKYSQAACASSDNSPFVIMTQPLQSACSSLCPLPS